MQRSWQHQRQACYLTTFVFEVTKTKHVMRHMLVILPALGTRANNKYVRMNERPVVPESILQQLGNLSATTDSREKYIGLRTRAGVMITRA